MKESDKEVADFLAEYAAAVSDLAVGLRAIGRAALRGAREELDRPAG